MIKKSFLPITALILAIVLLSGCFQPIKQGQAIISYSINKDGAILASTKITGTRGADFAAWKIDCKKEIKQSINQAIASYQNSLTAAATDEDKLGFASTINVLTNLKTRINCSAIETDANNAEANYSYSLTFEELQDLSRLPQQENQPTATKTSELIELSFPILEEIIQPTTQTNLAIKEIRIKAQGKIETIEPAGFAQQGEEMVLLHDSIEAIGFISLKINSGNASTTTITPNNNQNPQAQKDLFSSKIFGFDLILLIGVIFAVIVIVGLIIFVLRKSRETKPFKQIREREPMIEPKMEFPAKPEHKMEELSKDTIISRAMEKGLQNAQQKQSEESLEEFTVASQELEKKEKQEKTLEEELEVEQKTTENQTEETTSEEEDSEDYEIIKPKSKETFTIEEQQDIERLTKALMPKASDFTADDIKEAILNQGFSEKIAKEVVRKLGF